jgi:hypothetical protein
MAALFATAALAASLSAPGLSSTNTAIRCAVFSTESEPIQKALPEFLRLRERDGPQNIT